MENNPTYPPGGTDSQGSVVTEEVKAQAQQAVQQTQQAASQAAGQAKQQAVSAISTQKDQASTNLNAVSDALQHAGDSMRQQNLNLAGDVMDRAASQVDRLASYLQQNDVNGIVRDVEDMGRRSPTLFLGGAFALGLLAARFIKSSPQSQSGGQYGGQYYGASGSASSYANGSYNTGDSAGISGQPQGSYNYQNVPYRYEDVQGVPYVERRYAPSMMDETTDINADAGTDFGSRAQERDYGNPNQ